MASTEKALEEKLVEVGNGLLAPPSDVDELLPLLDKAEFFLSRVEQSPSESMLVALHPAMKGLIANELLRHSDADVKISVASCISEITRITAPDAPYDDDLMKEIFQMIVKAFENLDDISSCSYSKRVSILETVAKVRSCVVMLDLECDDLILEMFHHFLKTIRDNHPENVFTSMEVIMTLVLEESEEVSPELLSVLLMGVKKDKMDILPVARRLAEKVISNCACKLKPCLMEVVQSLGAALTDYSKLVATVCQENSDGLERNRLNPSGECVADDSKFSERTVSDELAQGSGKMESEVSCPEVGTALGRSPKSVMSNGMLKTGSDGCLVERTSPGRKAEPSRCTTSHESASAPGADADKQDLINVDTLSDHRNKNSRGYRSSSASHLTIKNGHSQIVDEKGDMELLNRKKDHTKETDSSQSECPSSKETEPTTQNEPKKGAEAQAAVEKFNKKRLPSSGEKLPDVIRPKRGRTSGAKVSIKKGGAGAVPISASSLDKAVGIEEVDAEAAFRSKKQIEGTSDLDAKPSRRLRKKLSARSEDVSAKQSSEFHGMVETDVGSDDGVLLRKRKQHMEVTEGDTSGRRQASKRKQQKSSDSSYNEMISSPKMASKAVSDQIVLEDGLKSKSRKKRTREEDSGTPAHVEYDESLVGAKIRVWWPKDAKFYPGTVGSYNPISKKHKVIYFDGDVEILLMKKQRFEFIEGSEEEEGKSSLLPESASDMSQKKAKKSDSSLRKSKMSDTLKSGSSAGGFGVDRTESEAKDSDDDATKSFSVRRSGVSKSGKETDGRTLSGSKSKKADEKLSVGTPKVRSASKSELNKQTDGTLEAASKSDSISKPGRKRKVDMPITWSRPNKGDALRSGSKDKEDEDKSGRKSRSAAGKPASKPKGQNTGRAVRKPRGASTSDSGSKSDDDGTLVEDKSGPSRGQKSEDSAVKVDSASRNLQENEGRRGKKRTRKSQG